MNQPEDKIQAITALSLTEKIEIQGTTVPFTDILASFENHKPSPTSYPYPTCPLSIPVQASPMGLFGDGEARVSEDILSREEGIDGLAP